MTNETEHVWPEGHWDWPIKLPYKHGVKRGNVVFVGGQVAMDEAGKVLYPGDVARQTEIAMENVKKVLAGFGARMDDVVKLNRFLCRCREEGGLGGRSPRSSLVLQGTGASRHRHTPPRARLRGSHGRDRGHRDRRVNRRFPH